MRYADDSRVSTFLRQLVVASVILPSDVVFFFFTQFFGLGPCLVFWLEYQGLMVHVRKTMKMRREEQKEFGVGVVDFSFLLSAIYLFLYAGISTWHVSCEKNRVSIQSINMGKPKTPSFSFTPFCIFHSFSLTHTHPLPFVPPPPPHQSLR